MIHLMRKRIDPENMPVLYDVPFSPETFERDFEVRDGEWCVEKGWLTGESRRNFASMAIMRRSFFGPVCLDFRAKVLSPCTHDINCMWSGSWNEADNSRGLAYVAGIGGWWDGKVGFEKSPEYRLNCGTKLLDFRPERCITCSAAASAAMCLWSWTDGSPSRPPTPIPSIRRSTGAWDLRPTVPASP